MMTKTLDRPATLEDCPPRWATLPTEGAAHRLHEFEGLAAGMGLTLMPWQALVLRVASELRDDGLPRYRQVICLVPRQCGKSTLGALLILHRMLLHDRQPQFVAFAAQRMIDGIAWWRAQPLQRMREGGLEEVAGLRLYESPSAPKVEAANGSTCRIVAPRGKGEGHGQTYGLALIDEAWTLADERLEAGLLPTMRTIADPLFVIASTAGTDASTYLRDKVDRGRQLAEAGKREDIAYFEWSAAAEADIADPATWRAAIPALGHTVSLDAIAYELESASEHLFRQQSLNQWVEATEGAAIPRGAWLECQAEKRIKLAGDITLAIDAPPERHRAVAVACDQSGNIELAHWENGTAWLPDWLARQVKRAKEPRDDPYRLIGVAFAKGSAIAALEDQLTTMKLPLRPLDTNDFAHASAGFVEALISGDIRIQQNRVLNVAVAGAVKWHRGDKWRIGRRDQTCDISPVCAAAMAYHAATQEEFRRPKKSSVRALADYLPET